MRTLALTIPLIDFDIPLNVVVAGAIIGTTYALAGMGLTLTYQSDRVLNFAQGSMGALPGLFVASMVVDHGMNYWIALLAAVTIGAGSGALLQVAVIQRLRKSPRLVAMIATIAVAQLLLIPNRFLIDLDRTKLGTTPFPVPFHGHLTLGRVSLDAGEILVLLVAPVILVLFTMFLRRTTVGLASRATAENAEAAETSGIPTQRIAVIVWSLAGALAAIAAVLFGPSQPVLNSAFTGGSAGAVASNSDLLLRGLGAAMIGGLLNLPQVFTAGIGIGILEALVRWNYPRGGAIQLLVVAVIVGSLLLRRDLRQLARGGEESTWSLAGGVRALPDRIRRLPQVRGAHAALVAGALLLAIALPIAGSTPQRILYSAILIYVIVSLSLVVLTGWAGQVSLGHFTFVALGAIIGGRMAQLGYPVFAAAAFAAAGGAVAAFLVGLPALRVRGLFLAVTTLAFAVFVDGYLVQQSWLVQVKGAASSLQLFRPKAGGIDFQDELTFYWVVLAAAILAVLLVHRMRRTGVSRRLMAVRDNEMMAAALSVSPSAAKLTAFVVSGTMASLAGYLYGLLLVNYGSANLTNPTLSLTMVTMVILGGATSITGAILGALYIRGLPYFIHSEWVLLLTSGGGLLAVLLLVPGGLASLAFRIRDRVVAALVPGADGDPVATGVGRVALEPATHRRVPHPEVPPPLEAVGVSVRYGGITALDDVTIRAEQGEIVGLIGPNGAGKTTLFDVLTGIAEPDSGRVHLRGEDVTEQRPEDRALLGLGRSFQQARLFDELTVGEAIAVALERDEPTELLPSLLGLPPARAAERSKRLRAEELIDLVGLRPFAEKKAAELSTGTRRIAELACIVALGADVILLDEPTGGVAQREVEALAGVLRKIRDHLDATLVVVAHDLPLIMGLVDRVYVLSSGQVIAEGPPSILVEDPAVVAAYLGTEPETVAGRLPDPAPAPAPARAPVPATATVAVLDPPDEADEPRKRWIEDPHLDMLTPGQRYTAVIAVAFVAALMTLGARGSGPEPFVLDRPAPAAVAAPASTTTSSPPKAATTTTTLPPVVDPMTVPAGLPADSALPPETTTTTEATVTTAPPPATTTTTAPPTTTTTLLPIPPLG